MLPASRPIPFDTLTADKKLAGGLLIVTGWAFKEMTNSAGAAFNIIDGQDASGRLVAPITLVTNESIRDLTGDGGLAFESGIFIHVVSGSISGTVWAVAGEQYGGLAFMRGERTVALGEE